MMDASHKLTTRRVLLTCIACLALVGLSDAIYLTVEHLSGRSVRCAVVSGCDAVLSSEYASVAGVPLAGFGAIAYFTVFSLAVGLVFNHDYVRRPLQVLVAAMFLFSLWLVALQAFVLKAYCLYCLVSATVTFLIATLLVLERRKQIYK